MLNIYRKYKTYGFFGLIELSFFKIYTLLFFSKSRIVRFPIYVRGKSNIDFGINFTTGRNTRLDAFNLKKLSNLILIRFGENVQLNDFVHIAAIERIEIGNNVLVASKVFITDHNHGNYAGNEQNSPLEIPINRKLFSSPVKIEDNVWLGEMVVVLPGVTIGYGTIVGSNSVVSKSLPPYTICVGSPAKPIKIYNFNSKTWDRIKN